MGGNKRSDNSGRMVFKDFTKPLEELANHPHVDRVSSGRSFHKGGSLRGFKPSIYDSTTHSLKVFCYSQHGGGQEIYVVMAESAVDHVKTYLQELNQTYFRK